MEQIDNPILKNTRAAARHAQFYDEFWKIERIGIGRFHEVRAEFITSNIEVMKYERPISLLDLGCGYGWLAQFVAEYGQYVGVDFSPKAIKYAKCAYDSFGKFKVADAEQPDLGIGHTRFDVLISSEVIEHVLDHGAYIEQIKSFLKPGGMLVLTTPNGILYRRFEKKYKQQMQPIENWLTPTQLADLLSIHGFTILKHKGALYRVPIYGPRAYLISPRISRWLHAVGLGAAYESLLMRVSVYQFVAAILTTNEV